jgi:hypothetical protein
MISLAPPNPKRNKKRKIFDVHFYAEFQLAASRVLKAAHDSMAATRPNYWMRKGTMVILIGLLEFLE